MSRLDLSCNNLIGEIPNDLGMLSWIHALNLSHNWLIGSIPKSLSNISQLESLDLSYNNLSGKIPSNLTNLHFLAVFTVSQNNLLGRIPDMEAQFETFDQNNYDGNPFLCGPILKRKCNAYWVQSLAYNVILWNWREMVWNRSCHFHIKFYGIIL